MTGSGKTGLCLGLIEEAAIDGVPVIAIDPKGDLGNLLLTFPGLSAAEFRPWVNEDDARLAGLDVDAFAAKEAASWAAGLQAWGQDAARIERLRKSAEFTIFTPGSRAGRPVSILSSFSAPSAAERDDTELLAERASGTATSALVLAGVDAPPRSREHSLVAALLTHAWQRGASLDLAVADPGGAVAAVRQGRRRRSRIVLSGQGALRPGDAAQWRARRAGLRSLARRGPARSADAVLRRGRPAARLGVLDRPSRRRRADVLRVAADEPDGRVDAPSERHDQPARHPLHGRNPRLLSAGGQPAVEGAAAHAAQAGPRVRPGRACSPRRIRSTSITRAWRTPAPGFSAGCRPNGTRPACSTDSKAPRGGLDRAEADRLLSALEEAHLPDAQRARRRTRRCSRRAGRCPTCGGRSRATRSRR